MQVIEAKFSEKDIRRLKKKLNGIADKKARSSMASAINRVARAYRKDTIQKIKARYTAKGITSGNKTAPLTRANPSDLVATVSFDAEIKHTHEFKIKKNTKKNAAKVAVLRGSFKSISNNGNKGFVPGLVKGSVFYRRGRSRLPIDVTFGPSLRGMAHAEPVFESSIGKAQDELSEQLQEQIRKWL